MINILCASTATRYYKYNWGSDVQKEKQPYWLMGNIHFSPVSSQSQSSHGMRICVCVCVCMHWHDDDGMERTDIYLYVDMPT